MFHKKFMLLLALAAAMTMTGCGGKKDAETEAPAATEAPADETEAAADGEEIEPITPADYLVKNVSDYITLGDFDNLSVTQNVYTVTDDMVQERIQDELYMYSEESEVEKAVEGNTVYADVVSSIQSVEGSESEESTYFTIGDEDYGEEFDSKLIGASAGDELEFSITYADDVWYEEWIDQTVDFKVTVTKVVETIVPEYDDNFVTENTEFETKSDYEESIREMIESEYEEDSYSEVVSQLFELAMDQSTYNGYPKELYTKCENEVISYYGQFIGESDTAAILEALDITQEDLDADVLYSVNERLLVTAICEEQNLEVTEDEYIAEVTESAENYGFTTPAEYEAVSGRESIVWSLYENKAAGYLYDKATITPVETAAEDLYVEFESEEGETDFYEAELME